MVNACSELLPSPNLSLASSASLSMPCCVTVQQGKPIAVPGAEAEEAAGGLMTSADTAPPGGLQSLPSPHRNMSLAASAPATDMPSIERVSCLHPEAQGGTEILNHKRYIIKPITIPRFRKKEHWLRACLPSCMQIHVICMSASETVTVNCRASTRAICLAVSGHASHTLSARQLGAVR